MKLEVAASCPGSAGPLIGMEGIMDSYKYQSVFVKNIKFADLFKKVQINQKNIMKRNVTLQLDNNVKLTIISTTEWLHQNHVMVTERARVQI